VLLIRSATEETSTASCLKEIGSVTDALSSRITSQNLALRLSASFAKI
jgi:hypothetical protein